MKHFLLLASLLISAPAMPVPVDITEISGSPINLVFPFLLLMLMEILRLLPQAPLSSFCNTAIKSVVVIPPSLY